MVGVLVCAKGGVTGCVWFMKLVNKFIKLEGHIMKCFTKRYLVCSELGDGLLESVRVGLGPSGFCHLDMTTRAPNCLNSRKVKKRTWFRGPVTS